MKFIVPVLWTMAGQLVIEADSQKEAVSKAEYAEFPSDAEYQSGSYEVNEEAIEIMQEEAAPLLEAKS